MTKCDIIYRDKKKKCQTKKLPVVTVKKFWVQTKYLKWRTKYIVKRVSIGIFAVAIYVQK